MKKYIFPLIFCTLVLSACFNAVEYPEVPFIENAQLNRTTMNAGLFSGDTLVISFDFQDGDGDIGAPSEATTMANVFLIDTRSEDTTQYIIPYISPSGTVKDISGTIHITILSENCFPNNEVGAPLQYPPTQEVAYKIFIKDRAENESNVITTPVITLICQ